MPAQALVCFFNWFDLCGKQDLLKRSDFQAPVLSVLFMVIVFGAALTIKTDNQVVLVKVSVDKEFVDKDARFI